MKIVLFEDNKWHNFYPLIHFRPLFCLVFGACKLWEKIFHVFPNTTHETIFFTARDDQLSCFLNETSYTPFIEFDNQDTLFVNARLMDFNQLLHLDLNQYIIDQNNEIAAFRIGNKSQFLIKPIDLITHTIDKKITATLEKKFVANTVSYLFEYITFMKHEMLNDFKRMKLKKNIEINKNCIIDKWVKFDASDGPIFIGKNSKVSAFTEIRGPVYIGENTTIDRAFIHNAVFIGNSCRISGEIETSIIMDYTNKHHTGFLGHSYLGQWVNIGAMSTTSDLKNNYSTIRFELPFGLIDSQTNKMGSLIGDHVKIAIGIMINCGTVIGEGSIVFDQIKEKKINSLSWGNNGKYKKIEFVENCIKIMKRRNVDVNDCYKKILLSLFSND